MLSNVGRCSGFVFQQESIRGKRALGVSSSNTAFFFRLGRFPSVMFFWMDLTVSSGLNFSLGTF
jgi:hypothetical protein